MNLQRIFSPIRTVVFGLLACGLLLPAFWQPATASAATLNTLDCPICSMDMSTYTGPLSAEEVNGLLLALNDEYHAVAVYDQVMADYGQIAPFVNIRQAEQNHINALLNQFALYNVVVPANPWPGNVASYGSTQEACQAGVDAEIANIALYDQLFASTSQPTIIRAYQGLQRGSTSHQQAFERCAAGVVGQGQYQGQGRGGGPGQGRGGGNPGQGSGTCPNDGICDGSGAGRWQQP
jgi:hypothetical protein